MFHRIQLGSTGATRDETALTTEATSVRHTQSELALEVNRIFLSNTPDHYQPLEKLQSAINDDQLYVRENAIRAGVWPTDFRDFIECYRGDDGNIDEDALLESFGERLPRAVTAGEVENSDEPSKWRIRPGGETMAQMVTSVRGDAAAEGAPAVSSPRSVFLPYSVWYISRDYATEASADTDLTQCWKTKVRP